MNFVLGTILTEPLHERQSAQHIGSNIMTADHESILWDVMEQFDADASELSPGLLVQRFVALEQVQARYNLLANNSLTTWCSAFRRGLNQFVAEVDWLGVGLQTYEDSQRAECRHGHDVARTITELHHAKLIEQKIPDEQGNCKDGQQSGTKNSEGPKKQSVSLCAFACFVAIRDFCNRFKRFIFWAEWPFLATRECLCWWARRTGPAPRHPRPAAAWCGRPPSA